MDAKTHAPTMTLQQAMRHVIRTLDDARAVIHVIGADVQAADAGIDLGRGVRIRRRSRITDDGDGDYYPASGPWSRQWGDQSSWTAPVEITDDEAARMLYAARRHVNAAR